MVLLWYVLGASMVLPWGLHGAAVVCSWRLHGAWVVGSWILHGAFVMLPSSVRGGSMMCPWCSECIVWSMVLVWCVHGASLGPSSFHGGSIVLHVTSVFRLG